YITVKVSALGYEDIPTVEVGSDTIVQIGDVHYYVLANDGDKALLFAKESVANSKFANSASDGYNNSWETSEIRRYLNEEWINSQPTILQNNIIETRLYTGYALYYDNQPDKSHVIETLDKVFLLAPGDFDLNNYKDEYDPRLYTAGISGIAKTSIHSSERFYLRSTIVSLGNLRSFVLSGSSLAKSTDPTVVAAVRPAFWIKLPSSTSDGSNTTPAE
ncbi:MAG: hypothetical protein K2F55_05085, partial [Erysipelotrichaceae bacterium]|nr:hypothetical protein [Erysipelotrichaceae bacterium]